MSILYRESSIDASYQDLVHLASRSINKYDHHRRFLFLIGLFFQFFFSETTWPNDLKLGREYLWAVLYQEYSFHSDSINKHGHHMRFLFLIGLFLKIFSSETAWPNDPKLGRKHLRLWWSYLLMDRDGMSNLYRGPSIDAFC
jgi:hypothetical protein